MRPLTEVLLSPDDNAWALEGRAAVTTLGQEPNFHGRLLETKPRMVKSRY